MNRWLCALLYVLILAGSACERERVPEGATPRTGSAADTSGRSVAQQDTLAAARLGVLLPWNGNGAVFVAANLRDSLAMDARVPLLPLLEGRASVADLSGSVLRFAPVPAARRDSLLLIAAQQECPPPIVLPLQTDTIHLLGLSPNVVTQLGADTLPRSSASWTKLAAQLHPLLLEAEPVQLRPELEGARYDVGRMLHFTYDETEYAVVESMREVVDTTTGRVAEQTIVIASRKGEAEWKREWSTRSTGIGEFLNTVRFQAWGKDPFARLLLIFETQSAKGGGGGILLRAAPNSWQDWLGWDAGC